MRRRSLSQRTSAYVVSTFAVFLVVIASLIGASTASAGDGPPVKTKDVTKFVKHKAEQAYKGVSTVFPNSQLNQFDPRSILNNGDLYLNCDRALSRRRSIPRWTCDYSIYFYEVSLSNPDQRTLRECHTPSRPVGASGDPDYTQLRKNSPTLYVERAKHGKKLRILGGWRMTCAVDEQSIGWWNETGSDYQPNVTEATPHEVGDLAVENIAEPRDDLLPAGADPGPAPGPLGTGGPVARSEKSGKNARPAYAPTFCNAPHWVFYPNGWYAIYGCLWDEPNLNGVFGATPNLYAQNQYVELYYYANTGYYKLFQSGWYQRGGTSCADQYGTYCRPQGIDAVHNEAPGPLGD